MKPGKPLPLSQFEEALFQPGDRVCCALSGGADSTALLLSLIEANRRKEGLGVVLSAVHVHHGLRGAEADADERFVRDLCDAHAVPLTVDRVDTPARQAAEREGVEEAARALRYAVFRRLMVEDRADLVTTAHTLDDQAETVMMKLIRGAWTEGLGGISPCVPLLTSTQPVPLFGAGKPGSGRSMEGSVVRPMLAVRRVEVELFLRSREQTWREDATNRDLRLTRNRVRAELMPLLRSFNPAIDEVLGRLAEVAQADQTYWKAELARVLPGLVLPGKPVRGGGRAVSTAVGEQAIAIELERLKGLSPALRGRVLREAGGRLGVRLGSLDTAKLGSLAGFDGPVSARGRIGAKLELRSGLRAERSAREIRLSRVSASAAEDVEIE